MSNIVNKKVLIMRNYVFLLEEFLEALGTITRIATVLDSR